jgi:hypothetical protein
VSGALVHPAIAKRCESQADTADSIARGIASKLRLASQHAYTYLEVNDGVPGDHGAHSPTSELSILAHGKQEEIKGLFGKVLQLFVMKTCVLFDYALGMNQ